MSAKTHVSDWRTARAIADCEGCPALWPAGTVSEVLRFACEHAERTGHTVCVQDHRTRRVRPAASDFEALGVNEFERPTWDPREAA